jgi:hypothetical protein
VYGPGLVTDGPTRDNRPLLFSHARGYRSETNRRGAMPHSIPTQFEAHGRPIKENRFDVRTQRVSDWLCEPCPRVAQLTKHQGSPL